MVCRVAVCVLLALLMAAPAATEQNFVVAMAQNDERVAGLVAIKEVFGEYPCEAFEAKTINLYSNASTSQTPIGVIQRLNPPKPPAQPDCDEPAVVVRMRADNTQGELPFDETGEEYRKAVVYERSGRWFRIAIPRGSAWIEREHAEEDFMPYPDALKEEAFASYLRQGWDGKISTQPGSVPTLAPAGWRSHASEDISIRVIATQVVRGETWVQIRFETERCGVNLGNLPPLE